MNTEAQKILQSYKDMHFNEAKLPSVTVGNVTLKVIFDREWEEYQVRWIEDKKDDEDKSYHTDDRDDAIGTMHMMAKEIK